MHCITMKKTCESYNGLKALEPKCLRHVTMSDDAQQGKYLFLYMDFRTPT